MSEPKKPISHAKEPSPKPDVDKKAARKGENASSGWTASLRWAYRFC